MRRATTYPNTVNVSRYEFQSTLSMRRATQSQRHPPARQRFQSTLSMRRATWTDLSWFVLSNISIHALHEESDPERNSTCRTSTTRFQSTLSMRRATRANLYPRPDRGISIHALHEESDTACSCSRYPSPISIHALHEESDSAAGHFCPLFETQASCLALSISNNTADTTNNMSKTSNWLSVSF